MKPIYNVPFTVSEVKLSKQFCDVRSHFRNTHVTVDKALGKSCWRAGKAQLAVGLSWLQKCVCCRYMKSLLTAISDQSAVCRAQDLYLVL